MDTTTRRGLYDVAQVAEALNVSPFTIRKWVRERRLPVTRIGRSVRFDPQALDQLIKRNTAAESGAGAEAPQPA